MKVCTCFLLIRIFAYTISSPLHSPKADKRDINIDLDVGGALEFNVVKNSITVSDRKLTGYNKISRRDSRPPRVETFTGFIQEVIKVLYTYDDNTFEDFFHILDKEIRNYQYRGFKFHELTKDYEIKNLLADKFDFIKEKSIRDVGDKIKHKVNNKNVKRLLNYINSVYKEDAKEEFRKVLTDLTAYGNSNNKEPNNDLTKIIRNGIQAIFFNHYTNLDAKEKRGLKKEIIVFLKGLTENPATSSKANFIPPKAAVSQLYSNTLKNITTKVKKPEIFKKSDPTSTAVQNKAENNRRRIHGQQSSDELYANEETILATSKAESDSQQLVLTFVSTEETYHESAEGRSRETSTDDSTDENVNESSLGLSQEPHRKLNAQPYDTLYIEDFYKSTEKPQTIINKSEMESNLAQGMSIEGMSIEGSTDRLPTARPNTKRLRHRTTARPASKQTKKVFFRRARLTTSRFFRVDGNDNLRDKDIRRSIASPMSNGELSAEAFDRERKRIEEALAKSYSFVSRNSIQYGLKDYIKRRRHLDMTINELKQECNQLSRINGTTYNGDKVKNAMNDSETKDKIHNNTNNRTADENIKETKAFSESQSSKYEMRTQTEKNEKTRNTTKLFNKDENYLEKKKGTVKSHYKNLIKLKKRKKTKNVKKPKKVKKTKKVKKSSTKKATKKTQTTVIREKNSTDAMKPPLNLTSILEAINNPVLLKLLTTAKVNNNLTETTSKATTVDYNATLNANKEIFFNNNATTVNINEDNRGKLKLYTVVTPSTRRQRRVLQYFSPPF